MLIHDPTFADVADGDRGTVLASFARTLRSQQSVNDTLATITAGAVQLVPGVDIACITVATRRGEVTTRAATDPAAVALNHAQQEATAGPCLTALWQSRTVLAEDLRTDGRWPGYAAAAGELGIRTVASVRLYVQDHVLGALSLYGRHAAAIDEAALDVAEQFAAHAAIALDAATAEAHLQAAIASRDLIGQAKGILMERFKVTDAGAFALLVRVSQNTNTPMKVVVARLVESGEFPPG